MLNTKLDKLAGKAHCSKHMVNSFNQSIPCTSGILESNHLKKTPTRSHQFFVSSDEESDSDEEITLAKLVEKTDKPLFQRSLDSDEDMPLVKLVEKNRKSSLSIASDSDEEITLDKLVEKNRKSSLTIASESDEELPLEKLAEKSNKMIFPDTPVGRFLDEMTSPECKRIKTSKNQFNSAKYYLWIHNMIKKLKQKLLNLNKNFKYIQ